jgi:hypothetical protein
MSNTCSVINHHLWGTKMSDPQTKLGQLIEEGAQRDAIHIAVAPVIASTKLQPGDHIGFVESNQEAVGPSASPIGIVDPFLKGVVQKGQRFWMFLYPNTITALKHVWAHPAFIDAVPQRDPKGDSDAWLHHFADEVGADYYEMMRVAESHCEDDWGDYLCEGGRWEGQSTPDEFWTHFAAVTGKTPKDGPTGIFSCSC